MSWYEILPNVLNMSLTGSVIILVVMFLRTLLRKVPKIYSYVLWSVVLFRLLCPFTLSAPFSLLGMWEVSVEEQEGLKRVGRVAYIPSDIVHTPYPEVTLLTPILDQAVNEALPQGEEQLGADPLEAPVTYGTWLWMSGILVMLAGGVISWWKLRQQLVGAVPYRDNIYRADHIATPFVLGLLRPRIYLPSAMDEEDWEYVIYHEQHHIRRWDPLFKALAYAALCIHWFNPFVWAAFILASRDMEMSCDEAVIRKLGNDAKAGYAASLLQLSVGEKIFRGVPVAFGETSVSGRIRNLARFHKPSVIAGVAAVFVCVAGILICVVNPVTPGDSLRLVERSAASRANQVQYEVSLGQKVKSGNIFVEQWVNGTCIPSAPVAFSGYVDEIGIRISERREKGQIIGMDVQVETNEYGGSLLTYTPFAEEHSVIGWSFTAHELKETVEIAPGEEVILAAMAFDIGQGVRVFDCETLITEPERLEKAERMIVIRAVFSEETMEPSAVAPARGQDTSQTSEQSEAVEVLRLQDVVRLASKGSALTWQDFEQYDYAETGSGLYIRVYDVAEMTEAGRALEGQWRLLIGGAGPQSKPMYIYLTYGEEESTYIDEWEERIDIREEDVEAFIKRMKGEYYGTE